jgi:hypothetical protein
MAGPFLLRRKQQAKRSQGEGAWRPSILDQQDNQLVQQLFIYNHQRNKHFTCHSYKLDINRSPRYRRWQGVLPIASCMEPELYDRGNQPRHSDHCPYTFLGSL